MILKDTYLLTSCGWNTVQNLIVGEKISGLHDNKLTLSTITNIKKNKYSGQVYRVRKSQVLPDTKLLTKTNRLKKIKNIKNKNNIIVPKYNYSGYKLNPIVYKGLMLDTCLALTLIGYFVECGKLEGKKTTVFKNNKKKLNTVSNTLNLLNIENFMSISNKGLLLYVYDKSLYGFLLQFYHDKSQLNSNTHKYIPRKFINLGSCYLRYLLESMLISSDFDISCITKDLKLTSKANAVIATQSKTLVDNIHEIAIKLGFLFNTLSILRDPMRKKQYNPLEHKDVHGYFETKILRQNRIKKITKNKIDTTVYHISTIPKLKQTLIRNNSLPLFIGT